MKNSVHLFTFSVLKFDKDVSFKEEHLLII